MNGNMNGHSYGLSNGSVHISNLMQAFEACGYHDNKVRKAGEEALKSFAKDPSYVDQLVSLSTLESTSPQVSFTQRSVSNLVIKLQDEPYPLILISTLNQYIHLAKLLRCLPDERSTKSSI